MLTTILTAAYGQKQAEIKFDKVTQDLGTFSESNPVQEATFVFTNVGVDSNGVGRHGYAPQEGIAADEVAIADDAVVEPFE